MSLAQTEFLMADPLSWMRFRGLGPNAKTSAVRAHVEHPFAHQKGPMGRVIRTIGIARATATVMLANMACNMRRWCRLDGRSLPA